MTPNFNEILQKDVPVVIWPAFCDVNADISKSKLKSSLDLAAPLKTETIKSRPRLNEGNKQVRRKSRTAESKWSNLIN